MLNAIVAQPDEIRNFGFESFTSDEIAEYDAWSDEVNAQVPDPNLEDMRMSFREMMEVETWRETWLQKKASFGYVPFDAELDAQHDLSDWERVDADGFAQSKGYRDAHHLQGTADLLSGVLQMKALEAEIESRNKRIALMEANLAMMQGGQS